MTTASKAITNQDYSFVLYKTPVNTKASAESNWLTLWWVYLSNTYPEEPVFNITAWIWWHTGTKEASHNLQMKLHIKVMLTFKTRRSRKLVISIALTM